ncbi:MAG: hypothetical protein GY873_20745 [Bosea sp.]|uniref:hypothetical protein n=1 Tax=Bosea sp. (in: a-proteobacteria) TaxID=1871050 RepID=UPI0023A12050|nr:hypothetical protein [Bosea sp. (in: a-proteobacteria)]MCP4736616.1 hypothetical protein [Bosea sp. (in: a-proteobacteria)]
MRLLAGFERVIRSFARVYAAGVFAHRAGVLALTPKEVGPAILSCCVDYLQRHRASHVTLQQPHSPLLALKQFVSENSGWLAAFSAQLTVAEIRNIGAFSGSAREILLTLAKFNALVGGSSDGKRLRRDLKRQGAIGITKNGNGPPRKLVRYYIGPDKQRIDLIQIKADRLAELEA